MSAIAGICHWDQRPILDADIDALAAASRRAGPDGGGTVRPRPGLVLQAHVMHFDRLSAAERQPLVFGGGSVLTWDGRLDNRDDLLVQLSRDLGPDRSDAALVAAAYARWGLACLGHMVGDWSLGIWDGRAQRVVLACDYIGNRPLYYLERPGMIAWATCLDALVDGCHLAEEVNESYIAARLACAGVPNGMTPYNGVRRLFGGHVLVAPRTSARVTRYWTFKPDAIRYQRPDDYTDRLRELLTDAVRVRLRNSGTVWAHLSGGWDSSSVVCLAHGLIKSGAVEATRLQPISHLWPRDPETDESPFMKIVERWLDLPTQYVDVRGFCTLKEMLTGHHRRPSNFKTLDRETPVIRAGGRVILTGATGDTIMQNSPNSRLALLDHLYQGHPFRFLQQCVFSAMQWRQSFLAMFFRLFRDAYLPPRWSQPPQNFFGVTPKLLAHLPTAVVRDRSLLDGFSRLKRPFVEHLYGYSHTLVSTDDVPELWWTHPFTHRPLVEFIVAVPPLAMWDPSGPRAGMRRALSDVLPPEILNRKNKGNFATGWERDYKKSVDDIADSKELLGPAGQWHLVTRGWVDPTILAHALDTAAADDRQTGAFLRACVDTEIWLRTLAMSAASTVDTGQPVAPPLVLSTLHPLNS